MNKSIKILVAHHKKSLVIKNDVYLPIHVGKALHKDIDLGIQGDDEGDNISKENPIYCEMTAWYWAWKNLKADYVGLCHYRRYFTFEKLPFFKSLKQEIRYWYIRFFGNIIKNGKTMFYSPSLMINNVEDYKEKANIFYRKISKILNEKEYDIVAPVPFRFSGYNNGQHFNVLGREHFELLSEIIKNDVPEYYDDYKKTMEGDSLFAANMAIFSYELFTEYCNFVFPILQKHKEETIKNKWCYDIINEKSYFRRSGYFAEILTSTFISKKIRESKKCLLVNTMFFNS